MTDLIKSKNQENLYSIMLSIQDAYTDDAHLFVNFIKTNGYGISLEGLTSYAEYLGSEINGRRLAASTYNKRLLGAKNRLRYLFKQFPESFNLLKNYQFEETLKQFKAKKINSHAVSSDRILSKEEISRLIEESDDRTITHMIRFLSTTGLRVSEMLNILVSDITIKNQKATIRITGKGNKERIVYIQTDFFYDYLDVRNKNLLFDNRKYLFEHNGKQYSRVSVTNRINIQGQIILGKKITAHTFRHSFATEMLNQTGNIKGVSKYLGHYSTSITADLYIHNELSWDDLKDL